MVAAFWPELYRRAARDVNSRLCWMKNRALYRSTRPKSDREVRERLLVGGSLEFRANARRRPALASLHSSVVLPAGRGLPCHNLARTICIYVRPSVLELD